MRIRAGYVEKQVNPGLLFCPANPHVTILRFSTKGARKLTIYIYLANEKLCSCSLLFVSQLCTFTTSPKYIYMDY